MFRICHRWNHTPATCISFRSCTIVSSAQLPRTSLFASHPHHYPQPNWPYLYQYKADWRDLWFKRYLLVVPVSNWPSLEPYLRRLYLVQKLYYWFIYTAYKDLCIYPVHTIDHISINIRQIEVIFGWKIKHWPLLFRICHLWNRISKISYDVHYKNGFKQEKTKINL